MAVYLELIVGPMGSSKTMFLFERLGECFIRKMKCLYINYINDNRDVEQDICQAATSHSPNPITLNKDIQICKLERLSDYDYTDYDVIAIDESHFFPDLYEQVTKMLECGKVIYCAGLNGDSDMKEIGEIYKLYAIADNIIHRKSICRDCFEMNNNIIVKNASFSKRICDNKDQFHVGGMKDFKPVCRYHYYHDT